MARLNNQLCHSPISCQAVMRSTTELSWLCKIYACLIYESKQTSRTATKGIRTWKNKCTMARLNNQPCHSPISSQVHVTHPTTELHWLCKVYAYLIYESKRTSRTATKRVHTWKNKCPKAGLNNQHHYFPISSQVQVMHSTTKLSAVPRLRLRIKQGLRQRNRPFPG